MLDPRGFIVTWNRGAERIKLYRSDEVIGRHFSIFYPAEAIQDGLPERELSMATANGRHEDEGWRIRKGGSRFWANVVITALRDKQGQLVRDGGVALGRGGFSAPYAQPVGLGRVSFDCHLSTSGARITGEGFIRWRSRAEGTIGVEFAYLEESCRATLAAEIKTANPRSFIPAL